MSKDNVYVNNKNRIFYLSDDIDNASLGFINSSLLALIAKDDETERKSKGDFVRKPIKLYINSFGGAIYDMWGLIDIIENSETPIHTYCTSYAMSAAFVIFIAGHKRFISPHVTLLYHQVACWSYDTYQDIVDYESERDWLQTTMEDFVKSHTNIKQPRLNTVRKNKIDWYIHADEAIELGIRWALSTVKENKGFKNQYLQEWLDKNHYNEYFFDNFTYMACGKGNSNAKEVLITNYEKGD